MRVVTKEIRWHETRPIFSCDLQPCKLESKKGKHLHPYARAEGAGEEQPLVEWRLATAGGDNHVRVWRVTPVPQSTETATNATSTAKDAATAPKVEYMATLSRHAAVVNVVRFSPTGNTLASAGDDGHLILWGLMDGAPQAGQTMDDAAEEAQFATEVWKIRKSVRVTQQEIYDLAWSPDGEWILVGSTDNTARVFSASEGNCVAQITDHNNYVQGVAWDPLNKFFATQSSDRHMHVYGLDVRRHASGTLEFHYNLIGKKAKMPVEEKGSESTSNNGFKPPPPRRSVSHVSDSESEPSGSRHKSNRLEVGDSALSDTEMAPPPRASTPSRRSSAASSAASPRQSASGGVGASSARSARSPSPMPPLPAIRVPSGSSPSTHQAPLPNVQPAANNSRAQMLYGSADMSPFFRRLAWSTDGTLLLTPAGIFEDPFATPEAVSNAKEAKAPKKKAQSARDKGPKPTVYIYSRGNLANHPVAHLPGHKSGSIAISFSPLLFELRGSSSDDSNGQPVSVDLTLGQDVTATSQIAQSSNSQKTAQITPKSAFDLPYRMIYAVATHESVYVYDTQQAGPICMFGNMHYAAFTDVSWSMDGLTLVVASQDGYCSLIVFGETELGTPLPADKQQQKATALNYKDVSAAPPSSSKPKTSPLVRPIESSSVGTTAAEIDLTGAATDKRPADSTENEPKPKKRRVALTTVALDAPKGPI